MPENNVDATTEPNNQKAILMLWLMLVTNDEIFRTGTTRVEDNATQDQVFAAAQQLLTNIDPVLFKGMEKLAEIAVKGNGHDNLATLRGKYQSFATTPGNGGWSGGGPDHPKLKDLTDTFFK